MTDESSEPSDSDEDATNPDGAPPDDAPTADGDDASTNPSSPDGDGASTSTASDDASLDDGGFEFGRDPGASSTDDDHDGETTDGETTDDETTDDETTDDETTDSEATDDEQSDPVIEEAEPGDRDGEGTASAADPTTSDDEPAETAGADDAARDRGFLASAGRRPAFPETSRAVLVSLVAMTVASLVLRFVSLGARVAHQDEGRVGYWIIRYLESGVWEYRAIVHGPFLFHVNKWVFEFLGPSDFTARLVVAVIGGLLPLTAWLFREHLRDTEVVALGFLLALNPVLVYYSRFMRNDVPLAAFMLLAVGFAVRYYDTGRYRHVFVSVGAFALGLTTKENGLLYAACWLGAAALLLDHRLFVANHVDDDRGPFRTAVAYVRWLLPVRLARLPTAVQQAWDPDGNARDDVASTGRRFRGWVSVNWTAIVVAVGAVVEFFAIIVFFYAPRGGGYLKPGAGGPPARGEDTTDAMGLYSSLADLGRGDPTQFLAVVEEALVGSWEEFTSVWGGHEHSYTDFLAHYVDVMIAGALVVSAFAIVGFLVDRYGDGGPRDLVALAGYWGFVSVLGYPIATDIQAGWATVHAIVPLAIPAAVGLAIIIRWGVESFTLDDGVGVVLAAVLLFCVVGWMGFAVADQVYVNPQSPDNKIIQYAQPSTDSKPTWADVREIGFERGGPGDVDVLFWGDNYAITNESGLNQPPAPGPYYGRRTWMWYVEMYQYEANQTGKSFVYADSDNETYLHQTRPPVVIAQGKNEGPRYPKDGGQRLHEWLLANGYERISHQRYGDAPDEEYSRPILFYIRTDPSETTNSGPRTHTPLGPSSTVNDSLERDAATFAVAIDRVDARADFEEDGRPMTIRDRERLATIRNRERLATIHEREPLLDPFETHLARSRALA